MSLEDFSILLTEMLKKTDDFQRRGQYMFNTLAKKYPSIAERIVATQYDPFYVDIRIPKFITYLTEFIVYD